MLRQLILMLGVVSLTTACAQPPVQKTEANSPELPVKPAPVASEKPTVPAETKQQEPHPVAESPEQEAVDPEEAAERAAQLEEEKRLPKIPLTGELLYQYLAAELASQRGMIGAARDSYLDMARKTRDPRIVRRAAEIAIFSRDQDSALEIARLWQELEPGSPRAVQTLAVLLVAKGKLDEAVPFLEKMLKTGDPASSFLQLPGLFASTRDSLAVLKAMTTLVGQYKDLPEAHYALGQAALKANQSARAQEAFKRAGELKPGWEPPALMQAQALSKTSRADALAFMKDFLGRYPDARDVRLSYARMLVSDNQLAEAGPQFSRLSEEQPSNAEIALAAGLLHLQISKMDEAEALLQRAVELGRNKAGRRDGHTARYYLGQVLESRKQLDKAMEQYRLITTGDYYVPAKIRLAVLLSRHGKRAEARAELKAVTPSNETQRAQLTLAEADLMREAKEHDAAYALLDAAVKASPDNVDLLYDRAMAAEKINKLDVMEADLRKVIKLRPDHAHAYNALGYTLIERTKRLKEAGELLEKAHALEPDDPFILDSLGWLHYRKGNLDKAKEHLERAWRLRQDPEIAAHLGEVLWMRGSHDEAAKIWDGALQSHPENEALIDILKKFKQ